MGLNFGVSVTRFSNGRRQARKTSEKVLRSLEGRIPTTTLTKSEAIRSFLTARFGPLEPFYIYAWPYQKFTSVDLGLTTDAVLTYTTPFKGATISSFLRAGTPQASPADYSLGTAANGETTIILTANPGDDQTMFISGVGRERIPVELVGTTVPIEHPLRRPQSSSETGAADFYSISVLEVP